MRRRKDEGGFNLQVEGLARVYSKRRRDEGFLKANAMNDVDSAVRARRRIHVLYEEEDTCLSYDRAGVGRRGDEEREREREGY